MNLFEGVNTLLGTSTNPLCHPDTKESGYLPSFYLGTYIILSRYLYYGGIMFVCIMQTHLERAPKTSKCN